MKKLQLFAASKGLTIVNINYGHCGHGKAYKGFDLVDNDKYIHVSLEPCYYSNGVRWITIVKGTDTENSTLIHNTNLSQVVKFLYSLHRSFKGRTGFKLSA